jgi:hypothetical protein
LDFTSRVADIQRRHESDPEGEAAFQAEVAQVLCEAGFDRSILINIDETAVRLGGGMNMTWPKVGPDGVWIDRSPNPKDCFTVPAGCTADGQTLPLLFAATGRTIKCHRGFGDIGPHWIAHTGSRWMTWELVIDVPGRIRGLPQFAIKPNVVVIMDRASCHTKEEILFEAARLNVRLIFVPPGATGRHHPMDFRVFGVLKQNAMWDCPGWAWTKADAVRTIIHAWGQVRERLVASGWRCVLPAEGDEQ